MLMTDQDVRRFIFWAKTKARVCGALARLLPWFAAPLRKLEAKHIKRWGSLVGVENCEMCGAYAEVEQLKTAGTDEEWDLICTTCAS